MNEWAGRLSLVRRLGKKWRHGNYRAVIQILQTGKKGVNENLHNTSLSQKALSGCKSTTGMTCSIIWRRQPEEPEEMVIMHSRACSTRCRRWASPTTFTPTSIRTRRRQSLSLEERPAECVSIHKGPLKGQTWGSEDLPSFHLIILMTEKQR